ncbi:S-layer homology domain-containing protein [Bacillus sp. FJAT-27231]|uniref:S-layer homology domain-containing protein n=1 Tax=Bacillus sp. FJAT-27231 TaxID=1679168 RepID=UPI0006712F7F|nr:S-layer homology domain-containing protein [Bacillus sp. FJAT-27231]
MKKLFMVLAAFLACFVFSEKASAEEVLNLPKIAELKSDSTISTGIFSPDDKFIVTGDSSGYITVYNAATGAQVNKWAGSNDYEISKVLFSPDGQRLVSISAGYSGNVKVWDVQTGLLLSTLTVEKNDYRKFYDIALNNDGTILYTADSNDTVIYWDVLKGTKLLELTMPSLPTTLAYNSAKQHLAIGLKDGSLNIRNAVNGEYINTKSVGSAYFSNIVKLKYSADNQVLYFSLVNENQPYLFDVDSNYGMIPLEENDYSNQWKDFDFNVNHKYIAVAEQYSPLKIFDTETKKLVAEGKSNFYYYNTNDVAFSHNGKRLVVGGTVYDTTILFNELTSIQITPASLYMGIDDVQGFTVKGKYSNGEVKAIPSAEVQWSSENPDVATFIYGKFQALKPGTATITASYKGFTAKAVIHVNAQQFTDLKPIHVDAVNYLVGKKITSGLSKTTFGTEATIKRVDAAIMIAKALALDTAAAPKAGFTDVPARGQAYVNALKASGIVSGKTKTSFGTNDQITRGEMALILQRAYKFTPGSTRHSFVDVNPRYDNAISSLVRYKIVTGINDYEFGTSVPITRGDFAIFLYNSEMAKK